MISRRSVIPTIIFSIVLAVLIVGMIWVGINARKIAVWDMINRQAANVDVWPDISIPKTNGMADWLELHEGMLYVIPANESST